MATTIRAAQLPTVVSDLANVTITTPQYTVEIFTILSDNRTLVFGRTNMIVVSSDYGVTQTIGKNFNDGTWTVTGVMQLTSGELMVALKHNTNPGEVWRSTGFVPATGQATSWAKVLTLGGPGLYCRSYWGFNSHCIAPSWSRHAGAIWITEYGNQTDVAATPDQGAVRTYLSIDDGQTWRSILDLRTLRPATDVHLHMHGVTYDPWDGRLLISHGDGGNGTGVGSGGIFYSDNPTDTAPTFTLIPQTDEHLGIGQVTTIAAFESGIISGPDGTPYAMRLIPRRGFRRYGPVKETAYVSGALPYVYIGARIRRNGGLENPSPGAPILMCSIEPSGAGGGYPQLLVSTDGLSVKELYRHNVAATNGAPGFQFVAGPTADGKIVASLNTDGTTRVLTADYVPALPATSTSGSSAIPVNVQTFTANGTWTKPAGVTTVRVQALGGGGGAGSGRVSASGTVASGGAGGSGAGYTDIQLPASALGATEVVTVGTGGAGGAAVLADSTNGNAGSAGTASTVGSKVRAGNGNAGNGGSTGAAASNNGGGGTASGQLGAGSSGAGAAGSNAPTGTPFVAAGGGSGGGVATTPAATGGGNGGASTIPNLSGGAGGAAGAAGSAGAAATAGLPLAGAGGGGGGSAITGAAGAGGNGGSYGSGGGGGGAALNGQGGSGAGGNGGPGIVIVTSW